MAGDRVRIAKCPARNASLIRAILLEESLIKTLTDHYKSTCHKSNSTNLVLERFETCKKGSGSLNPKRAQ